MVRGFAGFGAAMMMTPVFSALYGPAVGISLCLLLEIAVALPLLPRAVQLRRLAPHRPAAWSRPWSGRRRQPRADPVPTRADALGDLGDRAGGGRAAGQRLALPGPVARTVSPWRIGATSGFLNGLSGMAGPPIAFYYLAGNETVTRVRANLTTYFVFVDLAALPVSRARPGAIGTPARCACALRRPSIAGRSARREAVSPRQRGLLPPSRPRPAGRRGDRVLDPVSRVA